MDQRSGDGRFIGRSGNSQILRKFPSVSPGGRGGLATLLCLAASSHGFVCFCLGPRVQLIPPDFV